MLLITVPSFVAQSAHFVPPTMQIRSKLLRCFVPKVCASHVVLGQALKIVAQVDDQADFAVLFDDIGQTRRITSL